MDAQVLRKPTFYYKREQFSLVAFDKNRQSLSGIMNHFAILAPRRRMSPNEPGRDGNFPGVDFADLAFSRPKRQLAWEICAGSNAQKMGDLGHKGSADSTS
jgi:hypothetical protein